MPSLECEEFVECEKFRVCVASIETSHREISGPEPKFQSQSQPKLPVGVPSGFYFSEFTLGEVPGKKLANFYSADL